MSTGGPGWVPFLRAVVTEDAPSVARRYFDAIGRRDLDAALACWKPGGVDRLVPLGNFRAPDGMRAYFEDLFAAFPDFHYELLDLVAEGDRVTVRWRAGGTGTTPTSPASSACCRPAVAGASGPCWPCSTRELRSGGLYGAAAEAMRGAIRRGILDLTVVSRENFMSMHGQVGEMVTGDSTGRAAARWSGLPHLIRLA